MNILVISNLYPPNVYGGAEILIESLVSELRRSHKVTILTSRANHDFGEDVLPVLRLVKQYPFPLTFGIRDAIFMLLTNPFNYWKTKLVLRRLRPDLVFISDLKRLGFGPLMAAQEGFPTASFLHDKDSFNLGTGSSSGLRGMLRRIFMKLCFFAPQTVHFTLSNSESSRRLQHPDMRFGENRNVGVGIRPPNAFEFILEKNPKKTAGHRLIYIGRVEAAKGVHDVIEATALLAKENSFQDVELEIIGFENDPKYGAELRALAGNRGVSDRVKFLGRLSHEEKYSRLTEADILVFASTWKEGHGQTYLEAMLCGVPCVCVPAGGAVEVLRDRENCLTAPPGDAKAIAQACGLLWNDSALRIRIVENARQMVLTKFTAKAFADRCENALIECVSRWRDLRR